MSVEKAMDRLEVKIDRLDSRLDSIDVTLSAQHMSLREHMRRTEILETQIEPIKKHVAMVSGALKFIGLLGIIAGIAESVSLIVKG